MATKPGTPASAPPITTPTPGNVGGTGGGLTWPAANAVENAATARGQAVIDAAKNIGRVDTTVNPYASGPWPLARPK